MAAGTGCPGCALAGNARIIHEQSDYPVVPVCLLRAMCSQWTVSLFPGPLLAPPVPPKPGPQAVSGKRVFFSRISNNYSQTHEADE